MAQASCATRCGTIAWVCERGSADGGYRSDLFRPVDVRESAEKDYDRRLHAVCNVNWSAKNQARMHAVTGDAPYASAAVLAAHWVEMATCVAVTVRDGELRLIAPHGIGDLVGLIVRRSPAFTPGHRRLARARGEQAMAGEVAAPASSGLVRPAAAVAPPEICGPPRRV